ncbi:MAG: thiamine phosphate synthase [Polyangiaceae bacterium]|jgi:thiamine-phosphate pyrophosphorylase
MRGLYAIVDMGALKALDLEPTAFAEAILSVRPAALQLRAKDAAAREVLGLLRALSPMCHRVGVPLVANDRPDLALMAACDQVHVGQEDMPIERVRRLAPGIGVGVSTHTPDQLEAALAARPAYVAFGPVFATRTKGNADPVVGVAALHAAYLRASAAGVPLVAIGGISREKVHLLVGSADAVAVISELLPPVLSAARRTRDDVLAEVVQRARALQNLFLAQPVGTPAGS